MNADTTVAAQRLSPDMASFRLLVFTFVRDYIGLMGDSPSYGEIANKLRSNRMRVKRAILSLEKDGLLIRAPGPRGLKLPSMREEAIRQLRDMGWVVDEDIQEAHVPVTKPILPSFPTLDYVDGRTVLMDHGRMDGEEGQESRPRKRCA